MELAALGEEARRASPELYRDLLESAGRLLRPTLLELQARRAYVLGDLHGDLESLVKLLEGLGLEEEGTLLILLGDFVDRGPEQVELLYLLLRLKLQLPNRIVLLRGNHEGPPWLPVFPHDFPDRLARRYGAAAGELYQKCVELFDALPHACRLGDVLLLHGGLPHRARRLEELRNPEPEVLEELLWNDPSEEVAWAEPSPRGAGYLFGRAVTERFFAENDLRLLVRGHEPCEGFKVNHRGSVLTLFSRLGPPYYNARAALLDLVLQGGRLAIDESRLRLLEQDRGAEERRWVALRPLLKQQE